MNWIFELAKWSHVAAGIMALVIAPVAMFVRKGGATHRRWGKVYFWAMATIFATALIMLVFKPVIFLLAVAVLSFYAALAGYRVLNRKLPSQRPGLLDWAAAALAATVGLMLIVWGSGLLPGTGGTIGVVRALGLVFGIMIILQAGGDLQRFRSAPDDKNHWWYTHMDRMLSSYIGLTTAFLIQTVAPRLVQAGMPESWIWVVWVAPGVIGGFLVSAWVARYRRAFGSRGSAAAGEVAGLSIESKSLR
jgi:hypothetical protein